MKKIHKFNMVEIALAIAIIAIGISAILVLFPIGINATRAAMDENSSTDVAEYIANFVRGKHLARWKAEFDTWNNGGKTGPLKFEPPVSPIWSTDKPNDPGSSETPQKVDNYTNTNTNPHSGLQKYTTPGCYYFNRVSPEGEETFTALIKIWSVSTDITTAADLISAKCPIYVPEAAPADGKDAFTPNLIGTNGFQLQSPGGTVNFGSFAQSAMVEISWPANLPEDERTKRTFRVDVYNPYYMIQSE